MTNSHSVTHGTKNIGANRLMAVKREYPSGEGIRLISVNAGGSISPSRMCPGRSRIAGNVAATSCENKK